MRLFRVDQDIKHPAPASEAMDDCNEPIPVTSVAGDVKTRPASERSSKTTAGKPVPERMLRENGEGKESERSMSFQDRILNTYV